MICTAADRQSEIWRSSGDAGPLILSNDELMPRMIDGTSANKYMCLVEGV